jgi:hypothetical protein
MRIPPDPPGDGGDDRVGAIDGLADRVRLPSVGLDDGGEGRLVSEFLRAAGERGYQVTSASTWRPVRPVAPNTVSFIGPSLAVAGQTELS